MRIAWLKWSNSEPYAPAEISELDHFSQETKKKTPKNSSSCHFRRFSMSQSHPSHFWFTCQLTQRVKSAGEVTNSWTFERVTVPLSFHLAPVKFPTCIKTASALGACIRNDFQELPNPQWLLGEVDLGGWRAGERAGCQGRHGQAKFLLITPTSSGSLFWESASKPLRNIS